MDNDNVKVLGFQFEPGTISSYRSDILEKGMSASKTQTQSPSVRCTFGFCQNTLMESKCL